MTELARVIAAVYRRLGKVEATRNEFKQTLSFRLNWYAPAQASQILERGLAAGILVASGDTIRPTFDPTTVELAMDFRGSAQALEEPLPGAPDAQPAASAEPDAALAERAKAIRSLSLGTLEERTAILIALRERGEDVRAQAEAELQRLAPRRS